MRLLPRPRIPAHAASVGGDAVRALTTAARQMIRAYADPKSQLSPTARASVRRPVPLGSDRAPETKKKKEMPTSTRPTGRPLWPAPCSRPRMVQSPDASAQAAPPAQRRATYRSVSAALRKRAIPSRRPGRPVRRRPSNTRPATVLVGRSAAPRAVNAGTDAESTADVTGKQGQRGAPPAGVRWYRRQAWRRSESVEAPGNQSGDAALDRNGGAKGRHSTVTTVGHLAEYAAGDAFGAGSTVVQQQESPWGDALGVAQSTATRSGPASSVRARQQARSARLRPAEASRGTNDLAGA